MARFTVGRGEDATVRLSDDTISRIHLEVEILSGGSVRLTDLNSSNGSFIYRNGRQERFEQTFAAPDDRLKLGDATVSVGELVQQIGASERSSGPRQGVSIYVRRSDGSFERKS